MDDHEFRLTIARLCSLEKAANNEVMVKEMRWRGLKAQPNTEPAVLENAMEAYVQSCHALRRCSRALEDVLKTA